MLRVSSDDGDETIAKGGVAVPFPWRLHEMLKMTAQEGMHHIVSWAPHGRAFTVHKPKEFAESILPRYVSLGGCRKKALPKVPELLTLTVSISFFTFQILFADQIPILSASVEFVRIQPLCARRG